MKIRKGLLFSVLLVAGLVFVGFSPQSYAAKQKKDLLNDSALACSGSKVGTVVVKKKGSDVIVSVKITAGTANTTRQVFWTCQSGTGCHSGCGFVSLGTITTDGSGKGHFKYKGPAKFAGTIHFDLCPGTTSGCSGGNYFSGIFAAASDELVEASEDAKEGDPSLQ